MGMLEDVIKFHINTHSSQFSLVCTDGRSGNVHVLRDTGDVKLGINGRSPPFDGCTQRRQVDGGEAIRGI